jgi:hypothetical protein
MLIQHPGRGIKADNGSMIDSPGQIGDVQPFFSQHPYQLIRREGGNVSYTTKTSTAQFFYLDRPQGIETFQGQRGQERGFPLGENLYQLSLCPAVEPIILGPG